ncbi:MAG: hypothetical protein QY314_01900 [Candidatus Dojkabacteria bacterium]|nr:MAG: hypothetical protein QY314_01900 [Candidatus Dojkabacteria bacterium]
MALNKGSINLLTASIQPQGRWDRIYQWTVNTAKYIIIVTELIVLFAIGVRFTLDGRINDLDKEIEAQKSILDSRKEEDFAVRQLAQTIENIARMEKTDYTLTTYYKQIIDLIPQDVEITTITVDIALVSINGRVDSYDKLQQLESRIRSADFILDESFSTNQQSGGNVVFSTTFKLAFRDDGGSQ